MKKCLVLILSVIAAFAAMISLTACGKVDFTVKFTVDGETYASVSTGGSEVIKMPADPQKDGYTFDGWFWDDGVWARPFTANSLLNEPLKSDMTVYAKFSENNVEAEVKSKSLTVSGNDIKGKVPNSQTTFSFINDIEVADGANYAVYSDLACVQPVPSKTISLIDGDNICYILVTNGNDINLYTVTVRRRPIYTVAFDTSGGTSIDSQQVEEDSLAAKPADPEKTGYEFKGFDYDFSKPIVENITINAKWEAVKYKITYELNGGINDAENPTTYTIEDKIELKPSASNKSGYSFASWDNGGVIEKGSIGDKTFTANYTADVKLSSDGTTVTGLNNAVSHLVILSEYNGVKVTSIGDSAFNNSFSLMSITIPNSVTSIGAYAFSYGYSLTSVTIPDSVISIGDSAFECCSKLTSITIPDSVTSIGAYAFNKCTSLTSVTIPNSVKSIGYGMFWGCSKLTSVTILDHVTSLGDYAFYGCSSLTSVTIGDSVTSIGNSAFSDCNSLTSVTIPDSVTSIGNSAFSDCNSLTSVTIPDSVTSIGGSAFYYCTSLTSITIGDSVSSIGSLAFCGCSSLTSITIPDSVTYIGDSTFENCTSLKYNEYDNACYLGNNINPFVVLIKIKSKGITDCNISEKCKFICDYAFSGCTSLTSLIIPDSVTSIGGRAFYECSKLTSVTIGDGVTSIGNRAFADCTSLTSVTIPNHVMSIGNYTFDGCTSLTSVDIPDGVTSIGDEVFNGCSKLTSVTIGDGVTSIGDSAFRNCSSLTSVTIGDGVTSIGNYAFSGCTSLTSITIPDSVTNIGVYAFEGCSKLTSITIPNSVTSIGHGAFSDCTSLKTINYKGTEEQWFAIRFIWDVDIKKCTINYNYS